MPQYRPQMPTNSVSLDSALFTYIVYAGPGFIGAHVREQQRHACCSHGASAVKQSSSVVSRVMATWYEFRCLSRP